MQGNDASLNFLKEVFEEIFQLFPSPYVHIGGDEVRIFFRLAHASNSAII